MSHAPGSTMKALVKLGRDPGDCWTWLGCVNEHGRATKQFHGQHMSAQRWIWTQLFGPIPDGLIVTPSCRNWTCPNPHHLRCCFQAEANRDSPATLLVPADVKEIMAARKDKSANMALHLAEKHGVSKGTIYDIWARRSWTRARKNHGPKAIADEASA